MQTVTSFLDEWTAAERSGDAGELDRLLTDDFVGVGPFGFQLPKPAWLARHAPGELHYDTFVLDEVDVRRHGDTAVVVARQTGKGDYQGNPVPEAARASLLLVPDDDRWRLAGLHLSFIAGTPGAPPLPGAAAGRAQEGGER
jgi:ketosteroid isomerase-like protein